MRVFFICFLLLCACQPPQKSPEVLVTAAPYALFVEQIAGDSLTVDVLVPPGTNPHIYEPTPREVKRFLGSRIWFRLGEGLETRIFKMMQERNPDLITVDLTEDFRLREEEGEGLDRHLWMSPKLAMEQAKIIAQTLEEAYPEHKKAFRQGLAALLKKLTLLDKELAEELEPLANSAMLVSHPAFGYFCEEYNLKQLSIECEGKDPLPRDIEKTLVEAKKSSVRAVFTLPEYNNKGAILIAKKLKLPIYEIDPYAKDYFEMMRKLGDALVEGD